MRTRTIAALAIVLISSFALAQTTNQQQPSTGSQSGMPGMHHPDHQGMMGGNMQQHMQQMKAALDEMKQNLDAMKADAGKMDNEVGKDYMEKNNDLWQKMVDHLSMMMDQMSSMHAAPAGGTMHHGSTTAAPKKPATKPPQK